MKTRTIIALILPLWIAYGVEKVADHRVAEAVKTYWSKHTCSSNDEYDRVLYKTKTEHQSLYWVSGGLFYGGSVAALITVLMTTLKRRTRTGEQ